VAVVSGLKGGNVRADRTVIVIGAFLFMIGLAVAWNGYGYIELERGWSLVIAGTFGFCSGLVLVALGLVLRELRGISASAERATLLLAMAKTNGQTETALARPRQTAPLEPEPPFQPPTIAEASPQHEAESLFAETEQQPALALADKPEEKKPAPLAWMIRSNRSDSAPAAKLPQVATSDDWLYEKQEAPVAARHEELAPAKAWEVEQESQKREPEPDEFERAAELVEPEPEHENAAMFEPEPEPEAAIEPERATEEPNIAIERPEPEQDEQPTAPVVEADTAQQSAAEPQIIGHYDAHGAHYTMYSDGSIDAETPHGVYRFASMEELKRFIEGQ
jgi:hypothetical protein